MQRFSSANGQSRAQSTVKKGNSFRDAVGLLLTAAGYRVTPEVLIGGKKVDLLAEKRVRFRSERIALDAKNYEGALPLSQVKEFCNDYVTLVRNGAVDQAFLVAKDELTPQGMQAVEAYQREGLEHFTWKTFQREIFGPDLYLHALIDEYEREGTSGYYIKPRVGEHDLETLVYAWLDGKNAPPLTIFGEYGVGKSTFSRTLAKNLAERSLNDPSSRIPLLVPLGDVSDDNRLEAIFGTLLTSRYRIDGYNYSLFLELNQLGRFLIIFDGLDEMKHGMTYAAFQRNYDRLLTLHNPNAKIIILGRPNVFPTDVEFKSVIKGRLVTPTGDEMPHPTRPACRDYRMSGFSSDEAPLFVERYFRWLMRREQTSQYFVDSRVNSLLGPRFSSLIRRPVHAQMLCQVATDPNADLDRIDEFRLYDRFVSLLLEREVAKEGRDYRFGVPQRRRFNAAVSWWLLTKGGASTTTIYDVPAALCHRAVHGLSHNLDDEALRRQLIAGCLVEKAGGTVYFGHRSIQEFLAAEHLFETLMLSKNDRAGDYIAEVCNNATREVAQFLGEFLERLPHGRERSVECVACIRDYRGSVPLNSLRPFEVAYRIAGQDLSRESAWLYWLHYATHWRSNDFPDRKQKVLLEGLEDEALPRDVWLACAMQIAVEMLSGVRIDPAAVLAKLIKISEKKFIQLIADCWGSRKPRYVSSEDPKLYVLVSSAYNVWSGGKVQNVSFDPHGMGKAARMLLGFGAQLPNVNDLPIRDIARPITPSLVYSALNWKSERLDRIRPFFNDHALRDRIRPLEVTSTSRRSAVSQPRLTTYKDVV